MPLQEEHLARERSNAALELVVRDAGYPDWAVTALFYRAVHLVEAFFAAEGLHHATHGRRTTALGLRFPLIRREYEELQLLARLARYGAPGAIRTEEDSDAQQLFAAVEQYLRPRMDVAR